MKHISILVTSFLLLILVFFTFFGERIYESVTPKVKAFQVNTSITKNDIIYLQIPKKALTEDSYVYVITSNQGFSRTLYTLQKRAVEYREIQEGDKDSVYIESGISREEMIVSEVGFDFKDGDRVIAE
jgi:hypothetical protein